MTALRERTRRMAVPRGQAIRRGRRETTLPYAMVAPLVVFIGALSLYPTVVTAYGAFFRDDALDPPTRFNGLGNFQALFTNSPVRQAWMNTAFYVASASCSRSRSARFAVPLQRRFRGRGIVLALMVLPWALPGVVEGVIWTWIYDPTFGVLNSALKSVHVIGGYQCGSAPTSG